MLRIGELARLGSVSVRALRLYDQIGLIRPDHVDPTTGYRGYSIDQLGALNRVVALKGLGLSLEQIGELLAGITVEQLQGMLALRRRELEVEIGVRQEQLRAIEARLRLIEREGLVDTDDIIEKHIDAVPAVVIGGPCGTEIAEIKAVLNGAGEVFDQLGIEGSVEVAGPWTSVYVTSETGMEAWLALPVAAEPPVLPPPARFAVLPEIPHAAVAVRRGRVADVFPQVYVDLAHWIGARGGRPSYPGRELWLNPLASLAEAAEKSGQQVFEVVLPFDPSAA